MSIKLFYLAFVIICKSKISLADLKIENLEPISRSNNSALLYAAENCGTYIQLDVDFFRPLNPMMVIFFIYFWILLL